MKRTPGSRLLCGPCSSIDMAVNRTVQYSTRLDLGAGLRIAHLPTVPTFALALTTSTGTVRIASQILSASACFDGLDAAVGLEKTKEPDHDQGERLTGTPTSS